MTRRAWVGLVAVLLALGAAVLAAAPTGGERSVSDRTPRGYRAAFAYLVGAGGDVGTWEAPLAALVGIEGDSGVEGGAGVSGEVGAERGAEEGGAEEGGAEGVAPPPPGTTLVIAFPVARRFDGAADAAALVRWVRRGNRAVLLLDPDTDAPFELVERTLDALLTKDSATPPWSWGEWKAWAADRRRATGDFGTATLADPLWRLTCPTNADIVATGGDGYPRACRIPWGKGEIVLLSDATVWQNDHLARTDNLALLDALLGGRPVRFDEWHHDAVAVASAVPAHVPALFAAHLGGMWLLALLALAHRFGDRLPAPALAGPSMARALHALATLHRGSGHAAAAAARLHTLARARAARKGLDPDSVPPPPARGGDAAFAAWAARVGAAQEAGRF